MRSSEEEPLRWRASTMDPSALPARAADLVDAVREEPPLPPEVLARIKADVLARRPSRRRGLPVGLRVALLGGVVLASVATAKGTMLLWRYVVAPAARRVPARHRIAQVGPEAPAVRQRPRMAPPPVVVPLEPPGTPAAATPEVIAASARPSGAASRARRATRRMTTPATEAQLLARALSRLRGGHDARGALTLLDQYAQRLPARRARVRGVECAARSRHCPRRSQSGAAPSRRSERLRGPPRYRAAPHAGRAARERGPLRRRAGGLRPAARAQRCRRHARARSTARFTAAPSASATSGARTEPAPTCRRTNGATPRGDMRPKSAAFSGEPPVDRNLSPAADTQRSR